MTLLITLPFKLVGGHCCGTLLLLLKLDEIGIVAVVLLEEDMVELSGIEPLTSTMPL